MSRLVENSDLGVNRGELPEKLLGEVEHLGEGKEMAGRGAVAARPRGLGSGS